MFCGELKVTVPIDGDIRTLLSPLVYKYKDKLIEMPIGFKTNYGSVPMIFQNIISASGKATYGYVLHDYLYHTGMFTRDECDKILRKVMVELGVSPWRASVVYYALKVGGQKAWNACRKLDND
jgi:hypothetical protein